MSVSRRTALTRPTPAGARSTARDKVGTECRSGSFSDPKTASATTTVMNRKLNFVELRKGEVRRISLLSTRVNRGKNEGTDVPRFTKDICVVGI